MCVQHQTYPSAIFGTASLKNATGYARCFLGTVVHVFFLYLILLSAVWISTQLVTPPSAAEIPVSGWWVDQDMCCVYVVSQCTQYHWGPSMQLLSTCSVGLLLKGVPTPAIADPNPSAMYNNYLHAVEDLPMYLPYTHRSQLAQSSLE